VPQVGTDAVLFTSLLGHGLQQDPRTEERSRQDHQRGVSEKSTHQVLDWFIRSSQKMLNLTETVCTNLRLEFVFSLLLADRRRVLLFVCGHAAVRRPHNHVSDLVVHVQNFGGVQLGRPVQGAP
jgi:hypothetical protein